MKKHKKLLLIITALIILAAGASGYFIWHKQPVKYTPVSEGGPERGVNTVDYSPPTKAQQDAARDPAPATIKDVDALAVTITSANQLNHVLTVRALITPLVGSGTCTLTMSQPGQSSIMQTADIQASANASTCKGFTIPTGNMAKGTWTITLSATEASGKSGKASKDISIQ